MTALGTLGGSDSYAMGINDFGQVIGRSNTTGDVAYHAFFYSNGIMTDLSLLAPDRSSWMD